MTLPGNSQSFGDVGKACKRHADEFSRDPKENVTVVQDAHSQRVTAKEARTITEDPDQDDGDTDVENALTAINEDVSADLEETDVPEILRSHDNCEENSE